VFIEASNLILLPLRLMKPPNLLLRKTHNLWITRRAYNLAASAPPSFPRSGLAKCWVLLPFPMPPDGFPVAAQTMSLPKTETWRQKGRAPKTWRRLELLVTAYFSRSQIPRPDQNLPLKLGREGGKTISGLAEADDLHDYSRGPVSFPEDSDRLVERAASTAPFYA